MRSENRELVERLLAAHPEMLEVRNGYEETPLRLAIDRGADDIAELLRSRGAVDDTEN